MPPVGSDCWPGYSSTWRYFFFVPLPAGHLLGDDEIERGTRNPMQVEHVVLPLLSQWKTPPAASTTKPSLSRKSDLHGTVVAEYRVRHLGRVTLNVVNQEVRWGSWLCLPAGRHVSNLHGSPSLSLLCRVLGLLFFGRPARSGSRARSAPEKKPARSSSSAGTIRSYRSLTALAAMTWATPSRSN